jgi:fatty-acyl-CoA synthase
MAGHLHQPDARSKAIDGQGRLNTGDIATIYKEGYVSIVARSKDVIIRGGENIYPAEVEDLLRQHPNVLDACVIGVPDSFFGEESCAFLVLADSPVIDEEEMRSFLRERASHQKIPRYFIVVEDLPKTASGKVRRFVLKEQAPQVLELGTESGGAMRGPRPASAESTVRNSQTGPAS